MATVKEQMLANAMRYQSLGGIQGNPGYSEAAPSFNFDTGQYNNDGGSVWVGAAGGDTPEARAAYIASTGGQPDAFNFIDQGPTYSAPGLGDNAPTQAPAAGGQATTKEFYEWLNTPEGQTWADNQSTAVTPDTSGGRELSLGGIAGNPDYQAPAGDPFNWETGQYEPAGDNPVYSAPGFGDNKLPAGTGGVNVQGGQDFSLDSALRPELQGYESSSNKDFYQQQFANMMGQQAGQDAREQAAAIRAQESQALGAQAQQAPGEMTPEKWAELAELKGQGITAEQLIAIAERNQDPWGWADLPEVQTGGSVGATPVEWGLNPNITSGMTNQQVVGALGPILNSDESAMLAKNFRDNPDVASGTRWSTAGSPDPLLGAMGTNSKLDPNFANVLQKVFNNTYTQTGGGTGGISVPDGYANPIGG